MNVSSRDAGIPILTEVIDPAAPDEFPNTDVAPASMDYAASAQTLPEQPEDFEKQAIELLSDADWQRLERRIRERILGQILARIDSMLEQRIRDSLADVLQLALEGLTEQIRSGLHQSLDDVVSRAVSQEIARLQTLKK